VPFASPEAPVEIAFCQPDWSNWSNPDAYHIQYTPWESTELHKGWVEAFNGNCDEVWTTSELNAQWYKDAGVTKPIYVYEHGLTPLGNPVRRERREKLKFLHVGEPAMRKGGQLALQAFRDVFGGRTDVHLTIKAFRRSAIRVYDSTGSIRGLPHEIYKNVTTVYNEVSEEEMHQIYTGHHALVYPSWGEGFGFIPAEAALTGMPVVSPHVWAPYANHLIPELDIKSELVDSPWPDTHPGKMYRPDYESLKQGLIKIDEDYDRLAGLAFRKSFGLQEDFDWEKKTAAAFKHIVEKFS
jgi:glycosyltransferase involved in cell wall biosynthesis